RIGHDNEYDRDRACLTTQRQDRRCGAGEKGIRCQADQFCRVGLEERRITCGKVGGGAILLLAAGLSGGLWAWGNRPVPHGSILAQYRAARLSAIRDYSFCEGRDVDSRCMFGAPDAPSTILLWGDSQAAHLHTGLDAAAREVSVRILERTK